MKEQYKLAAIMFTDITGYSALMSKDEKHAMDVLAKNRNIHKSAIARFNGEYIKEVGDGTLAIFPSSIDAVYCAIVIQRACCKEISLQVRIGIHTGDIIIRDGDVFGDGVNIGSRIEAAGLPGGIYISEKVYDDIKNKTGIRTEFYGEKMLKNIDQPVKIFSVDAESSVMVKKSISHHIAGRTTNEKIQSHIRKVWKPKTYLLLGIGTLLLAVIVVIVFFLPNHKSDDSKKRIVVAIFENRTGDSTLDVIGKIAADWITQGFSQLEEVYVVPTTTVTQISKSLLSSTGKKKHNDYLSQLTRETNAGVLVSGSYSMQQEKLQFQAEVKDAMHGSLIYALPAISGSQQQLMELIERLSNEIIGGLAYYFHFNDVNLISKPPQYDAYKEYIIGGELFGRDYEKAIHHYMQAVEIDSLFLGPQFYIASAYNNQGEYFKADSVAQIISRNRERLTSFERHRLDRLIADLNGNYDECLRLLRLCESISPDDWLTNYLIGVYGVRTNKPRITIETYAKQDIPVNISSNTIAGIWRISILTQALHLLSDYQRELLEARKGQQYYPDCLWFYSGEVRALSAMGKIDEIKKVMDRCQTISSQTGTVGEVITIAALELRAHGYLKEAQEYALHAVEWYRNRPASMDVREDLASAFYTAEMWQDAQRLYEQLAAEFPDNIDYQGYLGTLAARRGDLERAMFISEKLKQIDRPYLYGQNTYCRACIYALLGNQQQAVELLMESFAQGNIYGVYLHREMDLESLRDYSPYQELLRPKE